MKYLLAIAPVVKQYGWLHAVQLAINEMKHIVWNQAIRGSYSQHYEDLILDNIFQSQKEGVYLDIGCHEPMRINNTYRLYKRGWSGICVDASADYAEDFKTLRPRDTYVQVGIGKETNGSMKFYEFSAPALSTFSADLASQYQAQGHALVRTSQIPVITLSELCRKHAKDRIIDLLCLDIEGYDLEALESLDWEKYKPRVICVETTSSGDIQGASTGADQGGIDQFLRKRGYKIHAHTSVNSIYTSF
jgi:FkbM family methyltransferase